MTRHEYLFALAQHAYSTSELNAFKKYFFLLYTTGTDFKDFLKPGKFTIEGTCLLKTSEEGDPLILPLHPRAQALLAEVSALLESDVLPKASLTNKKIRFYIREMAWEAGIALSEVTGPEYNYHRFYISLYPGVFNAMRSAIISECGIGERQHRLVEGYGLKNPSEVALNQHLLKNWFSNPFFDYLDYL